MQRARHAVVLASLLVALALALLAPVTRAQRAGGRVAVATENKIATHEALAQMQAGGTAVDAIVTAALVGGVASPTSSGIGGGGFALVWDAAKQKATVLDFREVGPKAIDVAAFERRPLPDGERGKLTGVPGEVAGLFELHRRFGKRPWKDVVAPAARWAKNGYPVGRHLGNMLKAYGSKLQKIDPGLAGVFYPGGKPAAYGNLVKNPKLGKTLERIAAGGKTAFYEGPIAKDIVAGTKAVGGALSLEDLKSYRPVERKPIAVRWEGHDVYTMPPPSAGGLMLAQTLGMFKKAELTRFPIQSGAYQHLVAEALRGAIADRARYLGDPDHEKVDLAGLLAPKRLAARRARIALDRTHGIPRFGLEEHGTHHLVAADAAGNFVSLTTTVNRLFGAKATASETGIVLNDELDDYTPASAMKAFGLKQSPNRPRPGARPVSSMTPTIAVKNGRAVLALGGSGGTAIATNVTQMFLARLAFGLTPKRALAGRRFYVPTRGAYIALEKGAPKALFDDLEARGEITTTMRFTTSAIQMIAVEKGRKLAASDPRKHGFAEAR